jgi:hypothetical protein
MNIFVLLSRHNLKLHCAKCITRILQSFQQRRNCSIDHTSQINTPHLAPVLKQPTTVTSAFFARAMHRTAAHGRMESGRCKWVIRGYINVSILARPCRWCPGRTEGFLPFNFVFVTSGFRHGVNRVCAFWHFSQITILMLCQRYSTTYRSIVQSDLSLEDGTDRMTQKSIQNYHSNPHKI